MQGGAARPRPHSPRPRRAAPRPQLRQLPRAPGTPAPRRRAAPFPAPRATTYAHTRTDIGPAARARAAAGKRPPPADGQGAERPDRMERGDGAPPPLPRRGPKGRGGDPDHACVCGYVCAALATNESLWFVCCGTPEPLLKSSAAGAARAGCRGGFPRPRGAAQVGLSCRASCGRSCRAAAGRPAPPRRPSGPQRAVAFRAHLSVARRPRSVGRRPPWPDSTGSLPLTAPRSRAATTWSAPTRPQSPPPASWRCSAAATGAAERARAEGGSRGQGAGCGV